MHLQYKRLSGLVLVVVCLSLLPSLVWAESTVEHGKYVSPETKAKLSEVEKRRQELREHISQARAKEKMALLQLNRIKNKLNAANGALMSSKHQLKKTETRLNETVKNITETHYTEATLSEQASQRLREIYEGQRLTFVEMLFQVKSLESLLDLFYFQERIADADRQLLFELRQKAVELAVKKDKLGAQKKSLGDMVVEFAQKALQINQEKLNQEQIAEKFKKQRAFYEQAERQLAMESKHLETQILDMESTTKHKGASSGSGNLSAPLKAHISCPFGWRTHPIFHFRQFHTGIDLAGANHSPIHAADSGSVLYTGWYGGYGKVVIISHGKGMATLYAHLSLIKVHTGDNVSKGDVIAYEGTTGFSTGPHLHFEVRLNGKPNNPLNYLR